MDLNQSPIKSSSEPEPPPHPKPASPAKKPALDQGTTTGDTSEEEIDSDNSGNLESPAAAGKATPKKSETTPKSKPKRKKVKAPKGGVQKGR